MGYSSLTNKLDALSEDVTAEMTEEEKQEPILTGGKWYDVQLAALKNPDGSVRVLFTVDGNVVFDYLDTVNPVWGDNGFGVMVQKAADGNGTTYLKNADLTESNIDVTVDYVGSQGSIKVSAPEGGWKEGSNSFTVTGDENTTARMVIVKDGDGYNRLEATQNADGSYSYIADLTAESEITVAVAGDVTGDGKLTTLDSINVRAAALGNTDLDGLELLIADVNGDGKISTLDSVNVKSAVLGKTSLDC